MWGARAGGRTCRSPQGVYTAVRRYAACAWRAARGGDDRDRAQTHNSKPVRTCQTSSVPRQDRDPGQPVAAGVGSDGADRSAVGPFGLGVLGDPLFSS